MEPASSRILVTGGAGFLGRRVVAKLEERGARDIRLACLIAAPEGLERLRGFHPDVPIWTAAVDEGLDENGFILPGLGDAGDRAYGTR